MPNHTTNIMTIVGMKKIRPLLRPYLSRNKEDGLFLDFNKIIPMPKLILQTLKFGDIKQIMKKKTASQLKKEEEDKCKLEKLCAKECGATGWYDWSIKNWGTKWNSYSNRFCTKDTDPQNGDEMLFFNTAWSPPEPVIRELSKKLGKIIRLSFSDEGGGFFGVTHFYPNGQMQEEGYEDIRRVPDDLCLELGVYDWRHPEEQEEDELIPEEKLKEMASRGL